MKISEAVKLAEKSSEVKELKQKGYFLNSGMAFLEPFDNEVGSWNLTYYNTKENKVAQIAVEGDSISLKEKGTPLQPTKQELKLSGIKTSSAKMLEKAKKDFKKYKQPVSQIILSVQKENEKTVWRINFITKIFYLIIVRLDAKTGGLLSSEMHSLSK